MKLTSRILLQIVLPLFGVLTAWAVLLYIAMIGEVNDEVDDSLELYSENLIQRHLSGQPMPESDNGTTNSFFIEVCADGESTPNITYSDETVWIEAINEYEPARVMRTTFIGADSKGYILTVMTPTIEKNDLRESILFWVVVLYFLLLAIVSTVIAIILRRSMKPLYRLLAWLDSSRIDGKHTPLDNPSKVSEFTRLNDAVVRYEERSREAFEQQKEFISNASHEIQTPLAVCLSRLEMLADTPLTEQQLGEVLKTQETISSISRLNQTLLLLSKIDNHQFTQTEKVDINALVRWRLVDLEEIYASRHISVTIDEIGTFTPNMDKSLALVMVTNLLKNAFVHNVNSGAIEVVLTTSGIEISNDGTEPLDGERIFNRFYQPHKVEGSSGLGLEIVESVAKRYGLSASYRFAGDRHFFAVTKV